jgi:radical SAM-linked protein
MGKGRLIFKKEGSARFISHLDTMRTMQRAFIRAGIPLRHTEGFNPHPYISLALPLSVGQGSVCEIMDFEISSDLPLESVPELLRGKLPEGITAVSAGVPVKNAGEIKWLEITGEFVYDGGAPEADKLSDYFAAESIIIQKKTKRGLSDIDVRARMAGITFAKTSDNTVRVNAVIAAQNPSLNPDSIVEALRVHAPELLPDEWSFTRLRVFDGDMIEFK